MHCHKSGDLRQKVSALYYFIIRKNIRMKTFVLLRHGESIWNKENRFTGWTDVDLTEKGVEEAVNAGKILKESDFVFDYSYTSLLKRAIKTHNIVLDTMDLDWVQAEKCWKLNEKHYGALQGLNKSETAKQYGEEQVLLWRRSYDVEPTSLDKEDPRNPVFDIRYKGISPDILPLTESLKDTYQRCVPYWKEIIGLTEANQKILITAHGNSLRSIIKYIKHISDEEILNLNLPTGIPYVFEFTDDDELMRDFFLGDEEEINRKMEEVKSQGKSS